MKPLVKQQFLYFYKVNTIKLKFNETDEQKSDLILALLSNLDTTGFDYDGAYLQAYFLEEKFDEEHLNFLLQDFNITYSKEKIQPTNWNETWEQNFEPIIIQNRVAIKAPFHQPIDGIQYAINIMPKMSFGTGHHATTRLMIEYMCETDFENKKIFDFGCGTGVLAIFAEMKNAAKIVAIDNDDWSVANALENCLDNHCTHIEISKKDIETINDTFDVILANIQLNILIQYKEKLKKLLAPSGVLLMSGLLVSDKTQIIQAFQEIGFHLISIKQEKEWIAIKMNLTS